MIIYSFFIYYFVMEHNWTCVVIPLYYFDAKIENTTARDHRSTLLLPAPAGPLPHQLSKAIYVRILIG